MKMYMKTVAAESVCLAAMLLSGCGGGNGTGADLTETVAMQSNANAADSPMGAAALTTDAFTTPTSSSTYVVGDRPLFALFGPNLRNYQSPETVSRQSTGAVTGFGRTTIGGDVLVKDISEGPGYAMGRWVRGIITYATGTITLTGMRCGTVYSSDLRVRRWCRSHQDWQRQRFRPVEVLQGRRDHRWIHPYGDWRCKRQCSIGKSVDCRGRASLQPAEKSHGRIGKFCCRAVRNRRW